MTRCEKPSLAFVISVNWLMACGGDTPLQPQLELDASVSDSTESDSAVELDAGPLPTAADPVRWRTVGFLESPRFGHSATLLSDGRVLVLGGENLDGDEIRAAELYDPSTEEWTTVASTPVAFRNHTAVILRSGRVLIVGGGPSAEGNYPSGMVSERAWLLDVDTWTWTETGSLITARSHHTATVLADGRVLIVGGAGATQTAGAQFADCLADAELYDEDVGAFSSAGSMSVPRVFHAATMLPSGEVLVVGGANETGFSFSSSEIYDPEDHSWRESESLTSDDRFRHAMVTLRSGNVLVAAGKKANVAFLDSAEILDDAGWHEVGTVDRGGNGATMSLLQSGHAIFIGGYGYFSATVGYEALPVAQIFDEELGAWTSIASLAFPRTLHTATVLPSGQVLVVGGLGGQSDPVALARCELSEAE